MKSYLITYDLLKPGQNYEDLYTAIKKIGDYWHCLESNWIIKTDLTATQIRDKLTVHIDKNDKILVCNLTGEAAWKGFDKQCNDWLYNKL